jgi:LemA protein
MKAPLVKGNNLTMGDLRMKTRRFAILLAVLVMAFSASGCGYNSLTTQRENVKAKWANIETQLQRRGDLINNLVEAAKMAGIQEQEVFGTIANARSRMINATSQGTPAERTPEQRQEVIEASNSLGSALGRLLVITEAYPTLRSQESFSKLMDEIAGTENRIAVSRQDYNTAVQEYNTSRARFPMIITAKLFGFPEEPYFKAEEGAKQVPQINANSLRQNQNK